MKLPPLDGRRTRRPYVVAEIGINHDGSRDQALRLIHAAAEAGADAVKFQLYSAARMYVRPAGRYRASDGNRYDIFELMRRTALPPSWLPLLVRESERAAVGFICTACDEVSARRIAEAGAEAIKIASSELTHLPLLHAIARTGVPVLASTGAATMEEIGEAIAVLRGGGAKALGILHCIAAYPAPPRASNLRVVPMLAALHPDVAIGFSDHSLHPTAAPLAASAVGAIVIEKHFTLDRHSPGADHRFSLEPAQFAEMTRALRTGRPALGSVSQTLLGSPEKHVGPEEQYVRRFARRSIFTTRAVRKGERATRTNVSVLRPGQLSPGLHPRGYEFIVGGMRFGRALPAWTPLRWAFLKNA